MHTDYRSMAFLLSLGSLPIACTSGDKDSDDGGTTSATAASMTMPVTMTATDPGTTTTGATGTDSTDPTDATPTTGTSDDPSGTTPGTTPGTSVTTVATESTTFITSSTDDTGTDDTGAAIDPTCVAYAAKITECFPRYADYRQMLAEECSTYKMDGLAADGQPCADAIEAANVCFVASDCADIMMSDPCVTKLAEVMKACPSLQSFDTDTGSFGETGET